MSHTSPINDLGSLLLVGIGGFAGANTRYLIELVVPSTLGATLTVNVLGCLALGLLVYGDLYGGGLPDGMRLVITTGFISSFTTYSTFVIDTVSSTPAVGFAYLVASYTLGFAAVFVGQAIAMSLTTTEQGEIT